MKSEKPTVRNPLSSVHSFASIEQLDEVTHGLGWATEYRQLAPGAFWSIFTILEDESWFLMEERSSRTVEVEAPAPEGMYAIGLVEGNPGVINSQTLSANHIFLQSPYSEFHANLPAGIRVTQIGILASQFEEIMHAVAPDLSLPRSCADSIAVTPGSLTGMRQAMRSLLFAPQKSKAARDEALSCILADFLSVVADQYDSSPSYAIHRASAQRALKRAMEYIEGHLDKAIRIESLSRHSGVSTRTLQRIFDREKGMTPQQYVRARRFNAIHRRFITTSREQGLGVTELALRSGFAHLGRFSADYRTYFGEYPRETLNRQ